MSITNELLGFHVLREGGLDASANYYEDVQNGTIFTLRLRKLELRRAGQYVEFNQNDTCDKKKWIAFCTLKCEYLHRFHLRYCIQWNNPKYSNENYNRYLINKTLSSSSSDGPDELEEEDM